MENDYTFRYILIGEAECGKSSILLRYIDNKFCQVHDITVGVEFGSKNIIVDDLKIKLHIFDTAGQEIFRSIVRSYYRNCVGIILVYDVTRRETYNRIDYWLEEIGKYASKDVSILIFGNKNDKIFDKEIKEIKEVKGENIKMFMQGSAKTGENIDEAFMVLTKDIIDKINKKEIEVSRNFNKIKLEEKTEKKVKFCCN